MQTIYYSTTNFIRHSGNLVDLTEFRRKLALAQEGSLAPRMEQPRPQDAPRLTLLPAPRPAHAARRAQRARRAWTLDACASVSVIVMTLTFALRLFL